MRIGGGAVGCESHSCEILERKVRNLLCDWLIQLKFGGTREADWSAWFDKVDVGTEAVFLVAEVTEGVQLSLSLPLMTCEQSFGLRFCFCVL